MKPERDANRDNQIRENWWLHGRTRGEIRQALAGLPRYIATVETSKHRTFQFLDASVLPDNKLIAIALDDAFHLGVLSSRIHGVYALAAGSWLGVGNDHVYVQTRCFETFPLPTATEAQQTRIRHLAERLDTHRKRQPFRQVQGPEPVEWQTQHPKLTFTDLYNVLEKLRVGTPLNAKEQLTHEHGLVTVLRQLHDDLDAAVAEAYALPPTATDDAILTHLCALNAQRATEERNGTIRWLRPAFQRMKDEGGRMKEPQNALGLPDAVPLHPSSIIPHPSAMWPKSFAEQALAVRTALITFAAPADAATLAKTFKSAKIDRIEDILETLASLGQARRLADGQYLGT